MSANITHLSDFTHMSTNISHLSGNTNISGDFQTSQFQTSQCTEMSVIFVFFTTSFTDAAQDRKLIHLCHCHFKQHIK